MSSELPTEDSVGLKDLKFSGGDLRVFEDFLQRAQGVTGVMSSLIAHTSANEFSLLRAKTTLSELAQHLRPAGILSLTDYTTCKDVIMNLIHRCLELGIAELENKAPSGLAKCAAYVEAKPLEPQFEQLKKVLNPAFEKIADCFLELWADVFESYECFMQFEGVGRMSCLLAC